MVINVYLDTTYQTPIIIILLDTNWSQWSPKTGPTNHQLHFVRYKRNPVLN